MAISVRLLLFGTVDAHNLPSSDKVVKESQGRNKAHTFLFSKLSSNQLFYKMVLAVIPEFSTMCMQAWDAFESINTCKGAVLDSLNCNESVWSNDCRDEGVELEAEFGQRSLACEDVFEEAPLKQAEAGHAQPREYTPVLDTIDTMSVSSSINPAIIRSAGCKDRRHIKLDSFTTFLPYDDDEIFRDRQASLGSDSQTFRGLCKLDRCTAFSQDSACGSTATSNVHPLKRDPPTSKAIPEVHMVHWDELVDDAVVNIRILA